MASLGFGRISFGVLILLIAGLFSQPGEGASLHAHTNSKHSFTEVSKCGGAYDLSTYAKMNQICMECYDFYLDHEIYRGCRKDCFTSDYFEGCLKVLHKYDDKDKIMEDLSTIHKLD